MFRSFVFLFVLLLLQHTSNAQKIIQGKIISSDNHSPVAYANIGIINTGIGTISNADGSFSLLIPARLLNNTLTCSSLGYGEKNIPLPLLHAKKDIVIYLKEKTGLLQPVIVSSKKEKDKLFDLGNGASRGGVYEPDTTYSGRSIALLIDDKNEPAGKKFPVFIEQAKLRIFRNNLDTCKFRIRIHDVNPATGTPGEDLLQQSIVVASSLRNGWLKFNLSDLNIYINKPFYITFEQILDLPARTAIANGYRDFIRKHPNRLKTDTVIFEGKKELVQKLSWGGVDLPGTFIGIASTASAMENNTCYERETSFAEWKKVRGIVTALVTVSKQPDPVVKENTEQPCGNNKACLAEKMCKAFMEESGMHGMQLLVSKGNKPAWKINLGYADAENKLPVTDGTQFRINSISKSLTSLALIQLAAANKLNLDAPVQQYLPALPAKPFSFTTRQLAGHLAGFRDYREDDLTDIIRTKHYNNATAALDIFKDDSLLFKPGEQFHYSGFGWNMIGAVIEAVSKQTYAGYMLQHIWNPLTLRSTTVDDINNRSPNRSKFYDAAGEVNDLGDLSYKYPAAGILSTAEDLVKIGNELLHGNFIDPTLKATLFATQHTAGGIATGYGLGWYTGKDKNGHRIWYHAGDMFSSSSYLIIYPDDDLVIAFLGNGQEGAAFDVEKTGELFYR